MDLVTRKKRQTRETSWQKGHFLPGFKLLLLRRRDKYSVGHRVLKKSLVLIEIQTIKMPRFTTSMSFGFLKKSTWLCHWSFIKIIMTSEVEHGQIQAQRRSQGSTWKKKSLMHFSPSATSLSGSQSLMSFLVPLCTWTCLKGIIIIHLFFKYSTVSFTCKKADGYLNCLRLINDV